MLVETCGVENEPSQVRVNVRLNRCELKALVEQTDEVLMISDQYGNEYPLVVTGVRDLLEEHL